MAEKNSILHNSIKSSEKDCQINFSEISYDTQCVINIELNKDNTKSIKINYDSDPNELAYSFCHENNLDYKSLNFLSNKIKAIKETILSNSKELRVSSIKFNKSLICDSQTKNKSDYLNLKSINNVNNGLNNNFNTIEYDIKNTQNLSQDKKNNILNNINNCKSNNIDSIYCSNNILRKNNININKKNNEIPKTTLVINQTIQHCMTILENEEHRSKTLSNILESGNISGFNNINNTNTNFNNTNSETIINLTNVNNNSNLNNTFNNNINNKNSYTVPKIHKKSTIENGSGYNFNSVNSSNNDGGCSNNKIQRFVKFVDGENSKINARFNSCNFDEDNGAKNNLDIQYEKILTDYEDQTNEKEINISKIDDNSLNNNVNNNSILNNSDTFRDYINFTYSNNYSNNINNNHTNNYTFNNNYNKNENSEKFNEKNNNLYYSVKKEINFIILPSIGNIKLKKQSKNANMNQYNLNSCQNNNINILVPKIEIPIKNLNHELNAISKVSFKQRDDILKHKNKEINYIDMKNNNNSNNDNIKVVDESNINNEQIDIKNNINYSKESIFPLKSSILNNIKNNNAKTLLNSLNFSIDEKQINYNSLTQPNKLNTSKKISSNNSNYLKDYITEGNLMKNSTEQNSIQNSTINKNLKEFCCRIPNSVRFNMPNQLNLSTKKSVQLCLKNIYNRYGSAESKSIDINASNPNRYGTEKKMFGNKNQMKNSKDIMNYINKNANSICSSTIQDKNRLLTECNKFQTNENNNFYKKITCNNFNSSNKIVHKNYKNCLMNNLLNRNGIINALINVFSFISKDNNYLDVFSNLNRKNIPSDIFEPVQFIVKNCNQKQRFISINEFSAKGLELFDKLNLKDQIVILNFIN